MDIFSVITLLGGLAFFLYGMNVMSSGLEKLAGGKLEIILKKMTSNKIKSLLLGMGITIAIQSSSALTVMLVGLVNSGIMELSQTIGVLMGSNIGTTLTAWILSLSGIEGDNPFLRMLKPESFSPIIALIGVIMIMTAKHNRTKDIGKIMVGFSVLMTGMTLMSGAVSPLADSPQFSHILTAFRNPHHGRSGRRSLYRRNSEFCRICGYLTGAVSDGTGHLWHGDPHYHGTEHRYLCHCPALQHRRKPQRKTCCLRPHLL